MSEGWFPPSVIRMIALPFRLSHGDMFNPKYMTRQHLSSSRKHKPCSTVKIKLNLAGEPSQLGRPLQKFTPKAEFQPFQRPLRLSGWSNTETPEEALKPCTLLLSEV